MNLNVISFFLFQVHGKNKRRNTTLPLIDDVESTHFFSFLTEFNSLFSFARKFVLNLLHFLLSVVGTDKKHRNSFDLKFSFSDMYSTKFRFCILFTCLLICYCSSDEDEYREELYIRPLATGHTYFHFLFTTVASPDILKSDIGELFN